MNAKVQCSQALLLQADFDGELDAAQSAALESHREHCAFCAQALLRLQRARALLSDAPRLGAPTTLLEQVRRQVRSNEESQSSFGVSRSAPKWRQLVASGGIGAIAAGLLAFIFVGVPRPQAVESIVDNHVRAMRSERHLLDVVSTEHHTVKPWFAGQIDFAPPVKDMEAFGYPLRGARVDIIGGRSVAVMVYQAGKHSIDLSVEPLTERRQSTHVESRGFNIRHWTEDEFSVWAISDLNSRELDAFVEHWKSAH